MTEALAVISGEVQLWQLEGQTQQLEIGSKDQAEAVSRLRALAVQGKKANEERAEKFKTAAKKAHSEACALEKEMVRPWESIISRVDAALLDWRRREQEAERARALEEAKRQQEEARQSADSEVAALRAIGRDAEASEVERSAAMVIPAVEEAAPKTALSGAGFRETWTFDLLDKSKLALEFLRPDEEKIGKIVRAMGEEAHAILGNGAVSIYRKQTVVNKS